MLDAVVGEAVSDGLGRLTFENGGQLAERLLRWAIGVVGDAAGELEVDIEVGWEKFVQGQVSPSVCCAVARPRRCCLKADCALPLRPCSACMSRSNDLSATSYAPSPTTASTPP